MAATQTPPNEHPTRDCHDNIAGVVSSTADDDIATDPPIATTRGPPRDTVGTPRRRSIACCPSGVGCESCCSMNAALLPALEELWASHITSADDTNVVDTPDEFPPRKLHSKSGRKCAPVANNATPPTSGNSSGFTFDIRHGVTYSKTFCPASRDMSSRPGLYDFPVTCARPTTTNPGRNAGATHSTASARDETASFFLTFSPNLHPSVGKCRLKPVPYSSTSVNAYAVPTSGVTLSRTAPARLDGLE